MKHAKHFLKSSLNGTVQRIIPLASQMATAAEPASLTGIGDVVPNVHRELELVIRFGDTAITDGMELPPKAAASEPFFDIRPHHQIGNRMFCVVMFDPDAPSPEQPVKRSFLHWIRANIPGHDVRQGDVLCEYMGPAPPSGTHRYIFLLYEQARVSVGTPSAQKPTHSQHILPKGNELNNKRAKWSPQAWAKQHGLSDPLASLFFTAKAK